MTKSKGVKTIYLANDQFIDIYKKGRIIDLEILLLNKIPTEAKK